MKDLPKKDNSGSKSGGRGLLVGNTAILKSFVIDFDGDRKPKATKDQVLVLNDNTSLCCRAF